MAFIKFLKTYKGNLKQLRDEAIKLADNDWDLEQLIFIIKQTHLMLTHKISVTDYQNFAKIIEHCKKSQSLNKPAEILLVISGAIALLGVDALLLPMTPIVAQVSIFLVLHFH